ncbi:hypothetical protein [Pseudomonas sp. RIT-PI-S]|uniref:hypothetical protein n=1 Tax=Pseudomonas sp. RIT-PI-S TaxID=3035295 RepID=UPI0021D8B242|nr:hypothetical protein [Pseudomonas sp. RIT-PI-S]
MSRYVIHYTLDGQRRWDFAHLEHGSVEEAVQALLAIHGEAQAEALKDIRVTRAL